MSEPACCKCGRPIAEARAGLLSIDLRQVRRYRQAVAASEDSGPFRAARLLDVPDRPEWQPYCESCYRPFDGTVPDHTIPLGAVATIEGALIETMKLSQLPWFDPMAWRACLAALFPFLPWNGCGPQRKRRPGS